MPEKKERTTKMISGERFVRSDRFSTQPYHYKKKKKGLKAWAKRAAENEAEVLRGKGWKARVVKKYKKAKLVAFDVYKRRK